jgi:hypothetical protein
MAKYSRFDPSNKKNNRYKTERVNKEPVVKRTKPKVIDDDYWEDEDLAEYDLVNVVKKIK